MKRRKCPSSLDIVHFRPPPPLPLLIHPPRLPPPLPIHLSPATQNPSPATPLDLAVRSDDKELFCTKRIPKIRATEGATHREISVKEEELRQLVNRNYHDLLDSNDSILLIKQPSDSISDNLSHVSKPLSSLLPLPEFPIANAALPSRLPPNFPSPMPPRPLAMAARFPLLAHQAQLVEAFRPQIAQCMRKHFTDRCLPVMAHTDVLAAATAIDAQSITSSQALLLFLYSCRAWISQALIVLASDLSTYTSE